MNPCPQGTGENRLRSPDSPVCDRLQSRAGRQDGNRGGLRSCPQSQGPSSSGLAPSLPTPSASSSDLLHSLRSPVSQHCGRPREIGAQRHRQVKGDPRHHGPSSEGGPGSGSHFLPQKGTWEQLPTSSATSQQRSEGDICPQAVPKGRVFLQPEPWSLRSMGRSAPHQPPQIPNPVSPVPGGYGAGHVDGSGEGTGGLEERKATFSVPGATDDSVTLQREGGLHPRKGRRR